MTRLALLADLHFGSLAEGVEESLLADIIAAQPDAVLIAGDLTMSATKREFADARAWLDRLPFKRLIVPGNHDISKFNLFQRFFSPFRRFEAIVGAEERDPLILGECHIFGLNTVSPWHPHLRWQEGRVKRKDIQRFAQDVFKTPGNKYRIVLAHHPFAKVPDVERVRPVRRASSMLDLFHDTKVDLVLSGHIHQSFVFPITGEANRLISIGAPTALSSRRRGEENGYWLIDLSQERVTLTRRLRVEQQFSGSAQHSYERKSLGI